MAEEWFVPEVRVKRQGTFGGRTVQTRMFVNERGQMAWEVRTWTEEEPTPELYWVADKKIREAGYPPDFKIGGFIVEMGDEKKSIVLDAIKKWESDEIDKFR